MSYRTRCTEVDLQEELLAPIVAHLAISTKMVDLWAAREEQTAFQTSVAEELQGCKRTQEEALAWVWEPNPTNIQEEGSVGAELAAKIHTALSRIPKVTKKIVKAFREASAHQAAVWSKATVALVAAAISSYLQSQTKWRWVA